MRFSMHRWIWIVIVLLATGVVWFVSNQQRSMSTIAFEEFASKGERRTGFEATVVADPDVCAYHEWIMETPEGEPLGQQQSKQEVVFDVDGIAVLVEIGQMRAYLDVLKDQIYDRGRADAPKILTAVFEQNPRVRLIEYCLQGGQKVFARVAERTVAVPGGSERINNVLWVSSRPFDEELQPVVPLTPIYERWR